MADKIRVKRTEGSDPPAELDFGELAFIEGLEQMVVGKSDGSQMPIGSVDPDSFAPVAFSGDYDDLTNRPSIPVVPNLAAVALTGDYSDLTGKPTLFSGSYEDLTGRPATVVDLIPAPNVEVQTNRYAWSVAAEGYLPVYRKTLTGSTTTGTGYAMLTLASSGVVRDILSMSGIIDTGAGFPYVELGGMGSEFYANSTRTQAGIYTNTGAWGGRPFTIYVEYTKNSDTAIANP